MHTKDTQITEIQHREVIQYTVPSSEIRILKNGFTFFKKILHLFFCLSRLPSVLSRFADLLRWSFCSCTIAFPSMIVSRDPNIVNVILLFKGVSYNTIPEEYLYKTETGLGLGTEILTNSASSSLFPRSVESQEEKKKQHDDCSSKHPILRGIHRSILRKSRWSVYD